MTSFSTHVLDLRSGRPVVGMPVELWQLVSGEWQRCGGSRTDGDGRCTDLPAPDLARGHVVRLQFRTATALFPEVAVVLDVDPWQPRYHVPLLLSPYGYSVYRGS